MIKPICLLCKGSRDLCKKGRCELLNSINSRFPPTFKNEKIKDLFGSSPPSLFIGRYGYPSVNIGPMLSRDPIPAAWRLGTPGYWYGKSIEEIITLRTELVRSRTKVSARHPKGKVLEVTQGLAMSIKPVETEVLFEKEIILRPAVVLDPFAPPRGPTVGIKTAELTENPKIPRKVDAVVGDTDARTVDAVRELYNASISTYHLQRLLSSGLLGQKRRRRLVPTRWSITGMDDIIGKGLIKDVRDLREIGEVLLFMGDFVGNFFYILYLPWAWSFEMVETWLKGAFWASETASFQDHEGFKGRTTYASRITGAYYAARLSVLEHLQRLRRQAAVIVYREITEEYYAPLGVWVIREAVKKALERGPLRFSHQNEALQHIREQVRKKNWTDHSVLLKEVPTQRRLEEFPGPSGVPHAP
ncbi:MAG: hypothetical protein KAU14_02345 [Thermoplasmata archaeon]|nr:hypothetical protein [Thermoplasmata archaeon]